MAARRVPTLAPLMLMEQLDPEQAWRVDLRRTADGGRQWLLFLDAEPTPRIAIREP